MNVPIFCLVGMSGVGKTTYLNTLLADDRIVIPGFRELIYHTTRNKRYPEEAGYHFATLEEFNSSRSRIIEYRQYLKIDDASGNKSAVVYYTTIDDVLDVPKGCKGLICAASVDQCLSYMHKLPNVFVINITAEKWVRVLRLLNRAKDENGNFIEFEVKEIIRRLDEERTEYFRLLKDYRIGKDNMLSIDNTKNSSIGTNIDNIVEFMYDKIF